MAILGSDPVGTFPAQCLVRDKVSLITDVAQIIHDWNFTKVNGFGGSDHQSLSTFLSKLKAVLKKKSAHPSIYLQVGISLLKGSAKVKLSEVNGTALEPKDWQGLEMFLEVYYPTLEKSISCPKSCQRELKSLQQELNKSVSGFGERFRSWSKRANCENDTCDYIQEFHKCLCQGVGEQIHLKTVRMNQNFYRATLDELIKVSTGLDQPMSKDEEFERKTLKQISLNKISNPELHEMPIKPKLKPAP